jgi:hypothetical protein
MRLTSSMARTFSGSAIAMKSLFSRRETGMNLVVLGDFAGQQVGDIEGMLMRARLMGGTFQHAAHGDGDVLLADVGLLEDELDEARAFPFSAARAVPRPAWWSAGRLQRGRRRCVRRMILREAWLAKILRRFLTSSDGGTRYQSSRLGVASASSLAAC